MIIKHTFSASPPHLSPRPSLEPKAVPQEHELEQTLRLLPRRRSSRRGGRSAVPPLRARCLQKRALVMEAGMACGKPRVNEKEWTSL